MTATSGATRSPAMHRISPRMLLVVAVLLGLVGLNAAVSRNDACKLCKTHTVCLFSGVAGKCKAGRWAHGVGGNEKRAIVDEHNKLRNQVARGHERRGKPGPQPSAADMKRMSWDDELAQVAQRWADQCNYGHDKCRNVKRFYVGQNLYLKTQWPCSSMSNSQDWGEAIRAWYNEVALFDKNTVGKYRGSSAVGHYTQVVWANTDRVGCGFSLFQEGNKCKKYYVCNYGPGGNFMGQSMYRTGGPRSACPRGSKPDGRYPGLC